jgi:hypothetical protein
VRVVRVIKDRLQRGYTKWGTRGKAKGRGGMIQSEMMGIGYAAAVTAICERSRLSAKERERKTIQLGADVSRSERKLTDSNTASLVLDLVDTDETRRKLEHVLRAGKESVSAQQGGRQPALTFRSEMMMNWAFLWSEGSKVSAIDR